jgi:sulfonate transport system substrate-binding protein
MDAAIIRVGGVPEHFNLPWHLAIENGDFASRGLDIQWTDYKGGTGQMTAALRNGDADVCVVLTEGIVTDIINGNPSKVISLYVTTPLIWGVHTGAENPLQSYNDIFSRKYAISRFGSGSHLMAIVDARSKQKRIAEDQFVIVRNLDGALQALARQEADVFYWEKFTTKPYVTSGQLRRIGQFVTPWPCFAIAATDKILAEQPQNVIRMLRTIHDVCDRFMMDDGVDQLVSERYGLTQTDVKRWYHSTEWAIHGWVSDKMLRSVVYNLRMSGIIQEDQAIPEIIWRR